MKTSDNVDKIAEALHRVQRELDNPVKNETANGGKFSYDYTTLDCLLDHVTPVLQDHGLSVTQTNKTKEAYPHVVTTLLHESGQYIQSETMMMVPEDDPQEFGSAMTYARRYGLAGILGIASQEDDDGSSASRQSSKQASRSKGSSDNTGEPKGPASDKQVNFIKGLCDQKHHPQKNIDDDQSMRDHVKASISEARGEPIGDLSELTAKEATQIIDKLKSLPDQED